ncbi:MAG: hypothetical protein ACTSR4_03605, partial [Candidatus Hodarchaeales archaeon]
GGDFEFPWPDFDFDLPEFEIHALTTVLGLTSGGLFIIILLVVILVIIFIASIFISRKIRNSEEEDQSGDERSKIRMKELIKRRVTLGRRIENILAFLNKSSMEGNYNKGITEGYEQLDAAMKEFSKISRPGWLTPREYANMRIPYFNQQSLSSAVEIFYRSTYGKLNATQQDIDEFIKHFQDMITDFSILKWKADSLPISEGENNDD